MKKSLLLLLITGVGFIFRTYAQKNQDSIQNYLSLNKLSHLYQKEIDIQRGLYNGLGYDAYLPNIKGSPNFMNQHQWNSGNLTYNKTEFVNIPLKYDLVKDLVVVLDSNTKIPFTLNSEQVQEFWVLDHHFKYIHSDPINSHISGFYEVLDAGDSGLYIKRTKIIKSNSSALTAHEKLFAERISYYIFSEGRYHDVSSKNKFLNFFKENKSTVRNYLKKNNYDYFTDTKKYLIKGIQYYESLR
jgi:hypothetical protein